MDGPPHGNEDRNRCSSMMVKNEDDVGDTEEMDVKTSSSSQVYKGSHTVFIHKLYNMLEDHCIRHLIWWTESNDSFYIIPGEEFSKVLAQYFKHTNIASFIRQLNMYGFHKVNDSFHSLTNPNDNVTKWEFSHSSGNFRRGDLNALKQIKRRSSKNVNSHKEIVNLKTIPLTSNPAPASPQSPADHTDEYDHVPSHQVVRAHPPETGLDSLLNMRLGELGHNLTTLRHEHARLQLRYDTAIDELRKTNLDMVHLLDIIQKALLPGQSADPIERSVTPITRIIDDEISASPTSKLPARHNPVTSTISATNPSSGTTNELENELARFRASIIQRAAIREYDNLNQSMYHPQQQAHHPQQHHQHVPPQNNHNNSRSSSVSQYTPNPYYSHDPQPFRQFRLSSGSKSRNLSVLMDPLQSVPQSQADSGYFDHKVTRPHSPLNDFSSRTASNVQLYEPQHHLQVSDHGGQKKSHSLPSEKHGDATIYHPRNYPYGSQTQSPAGTPPFSGTSVGPQPPSLPQRSGSFPILPPNLASDYQQKRHSLNAFENTKNDLHNPPRSVPIQQPAPIANTTRDSISFHPNPSLLPSVSELDQNIRNTNSPVYSLLNPEEQDRPGLRRNRSDSIADQERSKKNRVI